MRFEYRKNHGKETLRDVNCIEQNNALCLSLS
jgi:hypothetical protein